MKEFKVGDRVRVKNFSKRPTVWNHDGKMDHLMGKVVKVVGAGNNYISVYDDVNKRTWVMNNNNVEPVNQCIVIYRKDNEVIALDKCTGRKAVAKCSPEDTFNFETGAKLAFERLMKNITFRVLALESRGAYFTKGKVYEFVDGVTIWDDGTKSNKYENAKDLLDHNIIWKDKLIEIKDGDDPAENLKKYEEKQPYNGKIIFTKGDSIFKTGHIYEIKDGKIKDPNYHGIGNTYLPKAKEYGGAFYSIDDVRDYFTGAKERKHDFGWSFITLEFIEVKND